MTTSIEDRIEAYLDGDLSPEQTLEMERALARPEVAGALSRALMVRELLRSAPPDFPPADLLAGLHTLVQDELADGSGGQEAVAERLRFPRLRAALTGASWSLRGPALAVASSPAARSTLAGLSTVRNALGPLASRSGGGAGAASPKDQRRSDKQAKKEAKRAKKARKLAKKTRKAEKKAKRKASNKRGGLLRRLLGRG